MATNLYSTEFEAQIALANKQNQGAWRIIQTENGWYRLATRPQECSICRRVHGSEIQHACE